MDVISDIFLLLFIGVISGLISYMMDYNFGNPGTKTIDDINPKSVLFWWTLFLAKNRLNKDQLNEIKSVFDDQLKSSNQLIKNNAEKQFKIQLIATARDFFSWEFAFGMCMYCTGFWISLVLISLPVFLSEFHLNKIPDFSILVTTPVISHYILRQT